MEILFTHLKPDIWQYKVAHALKEKGVKTSLMSLLEFKKDFFKDAFEEFICLDLPNLKPKTIFLKFIKNPFKFFKFFSKLACIRPDSAIIQGPPLYLTSAFLWIFKKRFPRIFFSYDVLSAIYVNIRQYSSDIEIWGEKYSFRNCDAILDKNSVKELETLPASFEIKKKPVIEFCSYPFEKWFVDYNPKKKLSKKDRQIHIVYVGFIIETNFLRLFSDITEVLKQKIHFHIYPNDKLSDASIRKITLGKKELKKYLHIHDYISPEKLSEEISKYDFGFNYFDFLEGARPGAAKYTFGNKRSAYFEAALPVIVREEKGKEETFICQPIKEHNLGISIEDITKLKKEIKKFKIKKSVENIKRFRKETSIERNINRLIEFAAMLKKKHAKNC